MNDTVLQTCIEAYIVLRMLPTENNLENYEKGYLLQYATMF
jgi:hypothetical protein